MEGGEGGLAVKGEMKGGKVRSDSERRRGTEEGSLNNQTRVKAREGEKIQHRKPKRVEAGLEKLTGVERFRRVESSLESLARANPAVDERRRFSASQQQYEKRKSATHSNSHVLRNLELEGRPILRRPRPSLDPILVLRRLPRPGPFDEPIEHLRRIPEELDVTDVAPRADRLSEPVERGEDGLLEGRVEVNGERFDFLAILRRRAPFHDGLAAGEADSEGPRSDGKDEVVEEAVLLVPKEFLDNGGDGFVDACLKLTRGSEFHDPFVEGEESTVFVDATLLPVSFSESHLRIDPLPFVFLNPLEELLCSRLVEPRRLFLAPLSRLQSGQRFEDADLAEVGREGREGERNDVVAVLGIDFGWRVNLRHDVELRGRGF